MRTATGLASALILALALAAAGWGAIIVDGDGGGDYLTIREGVDAAADYGDTVIVMPGIYGDTYLSIVCDFDVLVNVHFAKNLTLISSGGPAVTILDGQDETWYGIVASPEPEFGYLFPPPVVEGFTVLNGGHYGAPPSPGIVAIGAVARDNVCAGYEVGFAPECFEIGSGIPDDRRGRGNESIITENRASGNEVGVYVNQGPHGDVAVTVSGNTVDGNDIGISVGGYLSPGWVGHADVIGNTVEGNTTGISVSTPHQTGATAALIGNSVSGSTTGVSIRNVQASYQSAWLSVVMEENVVVGSSSANVDVLASGYESGAVIELTIGGSLASANDIFGSPTNLRATQEPTTEICIDASYNYWGSIYCIDFLPRFDITDVPDSCFIYLPFTDETHTEVFGDCETAIFAHPVSWGRIKELYR